VALLAAGALFASLLLLRGMDRNLQTQLDRLGADLLVVPGKERADQVRQMLASGEAGSLPADVPVAEWQQALKDGNVLGIKQVQGWTPEGGTGAKASALLIYLERWASPPIAVQEITAAIPGAEVVIAEQVTRRVARNLQPIVRLMTVAAGIALLGAVLMTGLLASIQVAERRGELGMMRAMGATRAFLLGLTLGETGLVAAAGAVSGVVLGGGLLSLASFARETAGMLSFGEIGLLAGGTILVTAAVALVAAAGPALRAARMDPLDAVRRGR
jgi:putative ABC transport system permease protein